MAKVNLTPVIVSLPYSIRPKNMRKFIDNLTKHALYRPNKNEPYNVELLASNLYEEMRNISKKQALECALICLAIVFNCSEDNVEFDLISKKDDIVYNANVMLKYIRQK